MRNQDNKNQDNCVTIEHGTQVVQTDSEQGHNTAVLGAGLTEIDLNDETSALESAPTCSTINEGGNQNMDQKDKELLESQKAKEAKEISKEICNVLRGIIHPSNQTVQQVEVNHAPNAQLTDAAVIANHVSFTLPNQEQSSSTGQTSSATLEPTPELDPNPEQHIEVQHHTKYSCAIS